MRLYAFLISLLCLVGCASTSSISRPLNSLSASVQQDASNACSPMLGWLGGVCCLGGITLLVISRGSRGWYPLGAGILFILINYALALYADWFFIPVAIATGAISLVWAGRIVWKLVKNEQLKGIKL